MSPDISIQIYWDSEHDLLLMSGGLVALDDTKAVVIGGKAHAGKAWRVSFDDVWEESLPQGLSAFPVWVDIGCQLIIDIMGVGDDPAYRKRNKRTDPLMHDNSTAQI